MYLVVFASRKAKQKNLPLLFQNEEHVCKMRSFSGGPFPSSVYLQPVDRQNVILVIKWTRPPRPFLHIASDQKLDSGTPL